MNCLEFISFDIYVALLASHNASNIDSVFINFSHWALSASGLSMQLASANVACNNLVVYKPDLQPLHEALQGCKQ